MPAKRRIFRAATVTTFAVLPIAFAIYFSGSRAAEPGFESHINLQAPAHIAVDAAAGIPRECDARSGIVNDCLWLD